VSGKPPQDHIQDRFGLFSFERAKPILSVCGLGLHMLPGVGRMRLFRVTKDRVLRSALLLSFWVAPVNAQSADARTKPDNTDVNKRDQNPGEATADQQKMNAADRALTAKIRKSVIADKHLSTYAHNVKIISQAGTVTLKSPVRSDDEVKSIMAKATESAGSSDKVVKQMSVKP
jgi:hyperosmotically inducible protein